MLTVAEAAKVIGVSSSTLRRLGNRKEITILRPSPRVLGVEELEVDRYLAKLRGNACQSKAEQDATLSSLNSAESAYIADAQKARRGRRPKRSKQSSDARFLRLVTSG